LVIALVLAIALVLSGGALFLAAANDDKVTLNIYKFWESPDSVSITYHPNGGEGTEVSLPVRAGDVHTIVGQLYTPGIGYKSYVFAGWNTAADGNGTAYAKGDSITIASDVTLYAQWASLTRTVTGYVWPMVTDDLGMGDLFLGRHAVLVELRQTFKTSALAGLSTYAVLVNNDGLGQFTIENVPYGEYVLYIKRPGYLARAMNVEISASSPSIVELAPPNSYGDDGVFNLWWGDCDDSGNVDNDDLAWIINLWNQSVNILSILYDPACDLNADGLIDNDDLALVFNMHERRITDYPGAADVDFGN